MNARIVFVTLLVALAGITTPVAAGTYDIDDSHDLDCTAFSDSGSTSDDLVTPDATISIEESHDNIGIGTAYFVLDYNEDIEHTIRVFIPQSCVSPYAKDTVVEVDGGPNAEYEVIDGGKYLAITVTPDESGEYVYEISKTKGVGFSVWERISDKSPTSDGTTDKESVWKYPEQNELHNYGSVSIDTDAPEEMKVQREDGERWIAVSDDPGDGPVFIDRKNESVTIVSTVEDPPDVRYNKQPTSKDTFSGISSDVGSILDNIRDDLNGLGDYILNKKGE